MILRALPGDIREMRRSLGMSQGQLAALAGMSRQTLATLEAGKIRELGVVKLEGLLAVLGYTIHFENRERIGRCTDPIELAARTASLNYELALSAETLDWALVSGEIPELYRAHMAALINELPSRLLVRTVDAVSKRHMVRPKAVWKHLTRWSDELQTIRRL